MSRFSPHRDEEQLIDRADSHASAVERAVLAVWNQVLRVAESGRSWHVMRAEVAAILRQLPIALNTIEPLLRAEIDTASDAVQTLRKRRGKIVESSRLMREDFSPLMVLTAEGLIPRISPDLSHLILFSSGWHRRLATLTRLADPDMLASVLSSAIANGATPRQAAALIRPAVQNVQSSAIRVARHEAVRVAHEARLLAYESLGDELVIGYQIHAVRDSRTRPEHAKRDGQKFWREPRGRQLGFDRMPRPPMESDGTVAFNCRCYLTPILSE
jgi:SPP1 gp7 family putative phage head morphogenesis protein